jgi:hypothetical protein
MTQPHRSQQGLQESGASKVMLPQFKPPSDLGRQGQTATARPCLFSSSPSPQIHTSRHLIPPTPLKSRGRIMQVTILHACGFVASEWGKRSPAYLFPVRRKNNKRRSRKEAAAHSPNKPLQIPAAPKEAGESSAERRHAYHGSIPASLPRALWPPFWAA